MLVDSLVKAFPVAFLEGKGMVTSVLRVGVGREEDWTELTRE